MRRLALVAVLVLEGAARTAPSRPGLLADLPDETIAALHAGGSGASPAATLDAVLSASRPYAFEAAGIGVLTDRRWFEAASAEGPGAPILELHRWPGDTILALYELAAADGGGSLLPPGLKLGGRRGDAGAWACREGTLGAPRGDYEVLWCERAVERRRIGALGLPGDAGLGPTAVPDLREALLAALRSTTMTAEGALEAAAPVLPELPTPPRSADERRDGWASFQAADFTLGLPPGLRALRLDAGVPAPRPMPYAVTWLRGRFVDRDGVTVVIGDPLRAGYVAVLDEPPETWTAGVAPPLGAPGADRADEARLDDLVLDWTRATRATVSHWKDERFTGDWLVFRLLVGGRGVEIGLPVVSGWRSLALFWIPVTYRGADLPPAPPPIDPAAALGVHFERLGAAEARRLALIEGYLTVADLRVDVPRGWWPVANLASRDGLPVTFVDSAGVVLGRIERRPAGSDDLSPRPEDGWVASARPASQHAGAVWSQPDGRGVLLATGGHGFVVIPERDVPERREGWRRMIESADFVTAARKTNPPGRR